MSAVSDAPPVQAVPAPLVMRVTAGAPAPVILRELAQAGWGYLTGREWQGVRSTLRALVDVVHPRYAQGDATVWQIARATGLTERWTRECLYWLEDVGILEWRRGGVFEGRPQAGWVRVVKTALIDLLRLARPQSDQASRDRAERTRLRLARAGIVTIRRQRSRRSLHEELSADLTPSGRGREGHGPIPSTPSTPTCEENTMASTTIPESVRLTRLRNQYMTAQGFVTPEDIAWAHRNSANVKDWDARIAAARKTEHRPVEDLTTGELW